MATGGPCPPFPLFPLPSPLHPVPCPLLPSCVYTYTVPHRLTVGDIMTREVVTLAEDDALADARTCMNAAASDTSRWFVGRSWSAW
jgi:hypothetical protein